MAELSEPCTSSDAYWKKVIIERSELWIGIRSDPTLPQRGISLGGKTYFVDTA
jgi:hypothetical protein